MPTFTSLKGGATAAAMEVEAVTSSSSGISNEEINSTLLSMSTGAAAEAALAEEEEEAAAESQPPQPNNNNNDTINNTNTMHPPPPPPTTPVAAPLITTRVDGKGLWRSWKRNFKNKMLALLDLIDNSLDAAIILPANNDVDADAAQNNDNNNNKRSRYFDHDEDDDGSDFIGRVHIYPDDVQKMVLPPDQQPSRKQPMPDVPTSQPHQPRVEKTVTTGLCIINNSVKPIRPLVQVLEVYNSSKIASGADDIGENGVGLKQGCATLSDLSFVLVKNGHEGFVELGMIAESLQMVEGCYLPAFRFKMTDDDTIQSLKEQMMTRFSEPEHIHVAKCIEQYGSVMEGNTKSNLQKGLDRLCIHFSSLLDFFDNPFVFAVILDDMSYGNPNDKTRPAADPIQDLRAAIPRTYLHIPHSFDFRIGNSRMGREKVKFHYWPRRLVELSSFTVMVNASVPWHDELGLRSSHDTYKLRVFIGFDRMRINAFDQVKSASLCIYSRQSGRLIRNDTDARFILGLNAGGSTYCQGLTVLIDDIDGKLPLNPTKQDVAFGEEMHGEVHRENLYAWVGSITKLFYDYHLAKFNNRKQQLTEKIKAFGDQMVQAQLKEIDLCQLTTFEYQYKFYAKRSIRINQRTANKVVGPDTHFTLVADRPQPIINPLSMTNGASESKKRKIDQISPALDQVANHLNQPLHANNGGNSFPQTHNANQSGAATHANHSRDGTHQQMYSSQAAENPSYRRAGQKLSQDYEMKINAMQQVRQEQQQSGFRVPMPPGIGQKSQPSPQNTSDVAASNSQNAQGVKEEDPIERIASAGAETANNGPNNVEASSTQAASSQEGQPIVEKDIEIIDLVESDEENDNYTSMASALPVANGTEAPGPNVKTEGASAVANAASNGNDDDSDESTKEYYKDLCEKLTLELVKRKEADYKRKKENRHLKKEIVELKIEVERQNQLLNEEQGL